MIELWRNTRGAVIVLVAITLPVLIGVTGLGAETGLWYVIKRHNQTAADFASISGALEIEAAQRYGVAANYPDICALAKQDATNNGFTFVGFTCPNTSPACTSPPLSGQMCVNYPPANGPKAGDPNYVEVILAQQQNTFFARLFLPNVDIVTRAVATVKKTDDSCILALSTTGPDVWVQGGNSAILNTGTCAISANSTAGNAFNLVGNPTITAGTFVTPGSVTGHMNNVSLSSPAETGVAPTVNPYASNYTHATLTAGMPTTCTAGPAASGTTVYNTDVRFCGGLTISSNKQIVDFQPPASGHMTIWITDGDLSINNGTLECTKCVAGGAGVTIILTKGTGANAVVGGVSMAGGNGIINSLNAPNSGPFAGLLIAQDPAGPFDTPQGNCKISSPCSTFQGTTGATFDGLVYFPDTSLNFLGNPTTGSNSCLLLVASKVEIDGSASFNDTGCPSSLGVPKVTTVALTE
jgi:hypothetical protein